MKGTHDSDNLRRFVYSVQSWTVVGCVIFAAVPPVVILIIAALSTPLSKAIARQGLMGYLPYEIGVVVLGLIVFDSRRRIRRAENRQEKAQVSSQEREARHRHDID